MRWATGNFLNAAEPCDGLITGDLLRLMLERAENCSEALEVFGEALSRHGQGGNCELRGNSHFDSSYLVSDRHTAFVIETAGRDWAAREVKGVGAISNAMTIGQDWQHCTCAATDSQRIGSPSVENGTRSRPSAPRAADRYDWLKSREGTSISG
jgi:dipeptidase